MKSADMGCIIPSANNAALDGSLSDDPDDPTSRFSRSDAARRKNRLDQLADRCFVVSKGVRPCIGCPRYLAQRPSEHDGHERNDLGGLRGFPRNIGLTDHRQYAAAIVDSSDRHYAIIKGLFLAWSRFGPACVRSAISEVTAMRHRSRPRFRMTLLYCRFWVGSSIDCRPSSTICQSELGFIVRRPIVYILFDLSPWWMNRQLWG